MSLLQNLTDGLRSLFRKKQVDGELNEELSGFLEMAAEEKIKHGMSRREAQRAVRLEQGNFEVTREAVRSATWESLVESCWQDLRYAFRQLRANPLFTTAAILSLALGIGANTAIFQLIDAVRLRTLPVQNPQEIAKVAIDHRGSASGNFSTRYPDLTYAMWEQIRRQQQAFSAVFAWGPNVFNIAPGGEVHNVQGLWVSGEFFDALGVTPAIGRLLGPEDDQPGCGSPSVVISYSFWQREYGGGRSVLERSAHQSPAVSNDRCDASRFHRRGSRQVFRRRCAVVQRAPGQQRVQPIKKPVGLVALGYGPVKARLDHRARVSAVACDIAGPV